MTLTALLAGCAAAGAAAAAARLLPEPGASRAAGLRRTLAGRRPTGHAAADDRLAAAGVEGRVSVSEVRWARWILGLVALALALPLAANAPGRAGIVVILALPAGAALLPDRLLAVRARRRAAQVAAGLPDAVALLLLACEAGLSPARALEQAGHHGRGLAATELGAVAAALRSGAGWDAALDALQRRCPSPAMATLVSALRRAHRHGVSPLPALEALLADTRAARAAAAREAAARAAPQIQLVVALLLVPAVLALVAAVLLPSLG